MKSISLLCLLMGAVVNAQDTTSAPESFIQLNRKLLELKTIRYTMETLISNPSDNYFSKQERQIYAELVPGEPSGVQRIIFSNNEYSRIYNGAEIFNLDHVKKRYDIQRVKATARDLQSSSGMYNSILYLRSALPAIIADPAIPKSMSDTLIDNQSYRLLYFSLKGKTIGFPSPFQVYDDNSIEQYYRIIVNRQTGLPFRVVHSNSASKDYYTQTSFSQYEMKPVPPKSTEWFYSSYTSYQLADEKSGKQLIKPGTMMPSWKLPLYHPSGKKDSLGTKELKGALTVVEFWIKNCGHCMAAFEGMKELKKAYTGKNVNIISINLYDPLEEIAFFYNREKPAYPMLYNGEKLAEELGVFAYPVTIVMNATGEVVYTTEGFNAKKVEEFIKSYLTRLETGNNL